MRRDNDILLLLYVYDPIYYCNCIVMYTILGLRHNAPSDIIHYYVYVLSVWSPLSRQKVISIIVIIMILFF